MMATKPFLGKSDKRPYTLDGCAEAAMKPSVEAQARPIPEQDLPQALVVMSECLVDSQEVFREKYAKFGDLFVGIYLGDALVGICYGWPTGGKNICLQGIGVRPVFAGKGHGSRLLGFFEDQVRRRGKHTIGLGSAGGYVEHFYLKNGYLPKAYFVIIPRDRPPQEYRDKGHELLNERVLEDQIHFNISTDRYDPEAKDALWKEFRAIEVGYVFEKVVG